ncbi:MAG TPA: helix-turn-helix domain-containing protein [Dermatophilaceae bacterium]|nr:helix-turn-helix domain-containing protein [Dermatophilaceae bacterium]
MLHPAGRSRVGQGPLRPTTPRPPWPSRPPPAPASTPKKVLSEGENKQQGSVRDQGTRGGGLGRRGAGVAHDRPSVDHHDVSAFLGVPVGTLYQWRHREQGPPAIRLGKHLRYDPATVRAWVDEQVGLRAPISEEPQERSLAGAEARPVSPSAEDVVPAQGRCRAVPCDPPLVGRDDARHVPRPVRRSPGHRGSLARLAGATNAPPRRDRGFQGGRDDVA